jgi:ATP-dependent Clp protease ATP-binding subunit ClpA
MSSQGQRICELAKVSVGATDPEVALRTVTELRRELDAFVRVQAEQALASGRSFGDLARALGISRQAAHRRFRELAPARSPEPRRRIVLTDDARHVLRLARVEALEAGGTAGSEHVLLAILRTRTAAARALRSQGVTLERARTTECSHRDAGELPLGRRLVRNAGWLALRRGDRQVGAEHLLLAALADEDGGATGMVAALGATPAAIQARLDSSAGSSTKPVQPDARREPSTKTEAVIPSDTDAFEASRARRQT